MNGDQTTAYLSVIAARNDEYSGDFIGPENIW
jgi:hypothetical protein